MREESEDPLHPDGGREDALSSLPDCLGAGRWWRKLLRPFGRNFDLGVSGKRGGREGGKGKVVVVPCGCRPAGLVNACGEDR